MLSAEERSPVHPQTTPGHTSAPPKCKRSFFPSMFSRKRNRKKKKKRAIPLLLLETLSGSSASASFTSPLLSHWVPPFLSHTGTQDDPAKWHPSTFSSSSFVARRLDLHILLLLLYIYVSFALSLVCVLYALPNDNNNISSRIIFGLQPNHILLPSPLMPPTPFYYLQIQKASPFVHFLGLCDGLKLIFPQHFNRPTAWLNILSVLFESHYNRWRRRLLNIIRHVCVVIVGKKRRTTNHGARIIHAHVHTTPSPSSVNLLHRLCNSKRRRK